MFRNLAQIHQVVGAHCVILFAMFLQVIPLGIPIFPVIILTVTSSYIILKNKLTFYSKDEQILGSMLILAMILEIIAMMRGNYSSDISRGTIQTIIYSLLFLFLVGGGHGQAQNSLSRYFHLKYFAVSTIISVGLISLVCLYKFYFVLSYGILPPFIATRLATTDQIPMGFSLMSDYNMSAVVFLIASFFSIYLYYHYSRRGRSIRLLLLPISIYFAFIAIGHGSRRVVLLLSIVFSIFLLWQMSNRLLRLKFPLSRIQQYIVYSLSILIPLLLLGLGISDSTFLEIFDGFSSRAYTLLEADTYNSANSIRLQYLQESWTIAGDFTALQFIIGIGNSYLSDMGKITAAVEMYPHNFFVSAFLKTGLIGLAHTSMVLLFVLRLASRLTSKKYSYGNLFFILGLVSPLFFSLFSGDTIFSNRLTSVFLVLLCLVQPHSRFIVKTPYNDLGRDYCKSGMTKI